MKKYIENELNIIAEFRKGSLINAFSLFEETCLLYTFEHLSRSGVLSIICLEELAKFHASMEFSILLKNEVVVFREFKKFITSHVIKLEFVKTFSIVESIGAPKEFDNFLKFVKTSKGLNNLKKTGLYVDIDKGKVLHPNELIKKDTLIDIFYGVSYLLGCSYSIEKNLYEYFDSEVAMNALQDIMKKNSNFKDILSEMKNIELNFDSEAFLQKLSNKYKN